MTLCAEYCMTPLVFNKTNAIVSTSAPAAATATTGPIGMAALSTLRGSICNDLSPLFALTSAVGPSLLFVNFWDTVRSEGGVIKERNMWSLMGNISWIGGAKKMLIRDCYERDANWLLSVTEDVALRAALILGPKGIGKTMFLNYLIVRIVEKARSENRLDTLSIAYMHRPFDAAETECVRFTSQGCTFDQSQADCFLSDSVDIADGTRGTSLLLEVASENQNNYKKFSDRLTELHGKWIIMDVWTLDELRQVTPATWADGEVEFLYEVFGGRVRNILGGDLDAHDVNDAIEETALWFFGDTVKLAYSSAWNRSLQLIRRTIAGARGKTTKDELAIQTSLFWVIHSETEMSGFSSTFLKLLAGKMKDNMEVSLWIELDKLVGGGGIGLMFEALGHMKLTGSNNTFTANPLSKGSTKTFAMKFNLPKVLIRSIADIETLDGGVYGLPIFGNFMLVDAVIKPNIMLQFTVSLKHGKADDLNKWAAIRANLGGSRVEDKLVFIIPAGNFGKFSYVGVPDDLPCYYMTWEEVANDTVLTARAAKRPRP